MPVYAERCPSGQKEPGMWTCMWNVGLVASHRLTFVCGTSYEMEIITFPRLVRLK